MFGYKKKYKEASKEIKRLVDEHASRFKSLVDRNNKLIAKNMKLQRENEELKAKLNNCQLALQGGEVKEPTRNFDVKLKLVNGAYDFVKYRFATRNADEACELAKESALREEHLWGEHLYPFVKGVCVEEVKEVAN
jgi:hypothetical protein